MKTELRKQFEKEVPKCTTMVAAAYFNAYIKWLENKLSTQEQVTDKDIETEANTYDNAITSISEGVWVPHGFIIGAKWMRNKLTDDNN